MNSLQIVWMVCVIVIGLTLGFAGCRDSATEKVSNSSSDDGLLVRADAETIQICSQAIKTVLDNETSWDDCEIMILKKVDECYELVVSRKPFAFGSTRILKIVDDEVVEYRNGL